MSPLRDAVSDRTGHSVRSLTRALKHLSPVTSPTHPLTWGHESCVVRVSVTTLCGAEKILEGDGI